MNTSDTRRFGGISRLFGADGYEKLAKANVVVVGLGGVGSWAAEALVRTGVGSITIIDGDRVELSNTNRQMPAMQGNYGSYKAEVLAQRFQKINPQLNLKALCEFVHEDNFDALIGSCDVIVDCIDSVSDKTALIAWAHAKGLTIIVSGGAGGKIDPTQVSYGDLACAQGDSLIAVVRQQLRKKYGFAKGSGQIKKQKPWGIETVYSPEERRQSADGYEGFGVFVGVTATAGMLLAQRAVMRILGK